MPTAQLTQATVETIGKPKPSRYPGKSDYRPVLFKLPDGSQQWKSYPVDAPELTWLKRGETYHAAISGDEFTLIQPNEATATTTPQTTPTPAESPAVPRKQQIGDYVTRSSQLYRFVFNVVSNEFPELEAAEQQAIASQIYADTRAKFDL